MFMYLLIVLVSAWVATIICAFECCAVTGFGFECCTVIVFLTVLLGSVSSDLAGARRMDCLAGALSNSVHPCKSVRLFGTCLW